jgi:dienelactone hydrolase
MKRSFCLVVGTLVASSACAADKDPLRVVDPNKLPADSRLSRPKDLNGYFPMTVPSSKDAWESRRKELREQVLVANGLWPLPERTPLNPVVHGKIERDGYTIEKVFFASYPGHYVCGNLYRPTGKPGKLPAVLSPHGHWGGNRSNPPALGRFFEASEQEAQNQIKQGAEKTVEGARYPLQARCAQLARMGCVVFHYDMVGYADSTQIYHPGSKQNSNGGFADAEGELRLQSFMGLQTWNCVRALDFLLSLPDVDPKRVGVTGASGGGTQTFILCAIDDRPAAAFPAVMVSTAMQGGCICENCTYLRQDAGNIDLAAVFAPKPLGMSGAKDWTQEIETKGLPELKALYKLYGAEDKVMAKAFLQFGHNYNQVSRELMYNWFNKHLQLGQPEPVEEKPFRPVPPKELSVFDDKHPLPRDGVDIARLRQYLSEASDKQIQALVPKDARGLEEMRRVIGTALRMMINDKLPAPEEVEHMVVEKAELDGATVRKLLLGRKGKKEQVPAVLVTGKNAANGIVVWVHPAGKSSLVKDGKLIPAARQLLDHNVAILAPDVFWTGELAGLVVQVRLDADRLKAHKVSAKDVQQAIGKAHPAAVPVGDLYYLFPSEAGAETSKSLGNTPIRMQGGIQVLLLNIGVVMPRDHLPVNENYAGYTYGYNRPLLANRVHDILTAVAYARQQATLRRVHLAGFDKAGPWTALARGLCGDVVQRSVVDFDQFRFEKVRSVADEMMLPGALKYGGLPALTALATPGELYVHNHRGTGFDHWVKAAYQAAGHADRLKDMAEKESAEKVVEWLVR